MLFLYFTLYFTLSCSPSLPLSLPLSVFFQHVFFKLYPGKMRTVGEYMDIHANETILYQCFVHPEVSIFSKRLTYSITRPRGPHTPPIAYISPQILGCKNAFVCLFSFLIYYFFGGQLYCSWWTLNLHKPAHIKRNEIAWLIQWSLTFIRCPNVKLYYCTGGECVGLLTKHAALKGISYNHTSNTNSS